MVSWEYFENLINSKSKGKYKVRGAYNKWELVRLDDRGIVIREISPLVGESEMENILNTLIDYIKEEEMASKEKLEKAS
jgi:hypothetical protein